MIEQIKKAENSDINRFRSPPYPFISLPKAIERVKSLHATAQHNSVGRGVVASAWKYSDKSSGLIQTAAALMQFGLLLDEGSGDKRRFRLSPDALRIAQDADPLSEKRKEALARAALAPKIHKEIWDNYGGSTSDIVLKNYLTIDRREAGQAAFSANAADDLINEFKETILFADIEKNSGQLADGTGIIQEQNGDEKPDLSGTDKFPPLSVNGQQVKTMQNERIIFTEEESPQQHLRLIAAGELNAYLLEALDDFVKRQRKRLNIVPSQ